MIKLFIAVSACCFLYTTAVSQTASFCKAVENGNFKKVERLFKKQVKKRKNGTTYYNGPGSGYQITHVYNLDTITAWLKAMPCVEDAVWDKCQNKIMIYPGVSSIGAKFKTKNGIVEKCFWIQEGTTGNINIFGWRAHVFKAKNKLVYKKMYDCNGFVELQKKNCAELQQSKPVNNIDTLRIHVDKLIGSWQSVDSSKEVINFVSVSALEVQLQAGPFSGYTFYKDSLNTVSLSGVIIMWPPQHCNLKFIDNTLLEISYGTATGQQFGSKRYRRL